MGNLKVRRNCASQIIPTVRYNAIYPGAFFCGSLKFPYRSILLSTTVLNDIGVQKRSASARKVGVVHA